MKYRFLLLAELVYLVCFFILLPFNRYCLNADGIAYIQQAKLYASGHFDMALNGCWNGLISILIAPFIKAGADPVITFKYVNGFLGLLCIASFYQLSIKFIKDKPLSIAFPFMLAGLMLSYVFALLSPDVLQLLLFSFYLNIICTTGFINSTKKMLLCSFIGALCYFAKAYNFYFFILNTLLVLYLYIPKENKKIFLKNYVKKVAIIIGTFLILCLPFILLISNKYHKFTISTASPITINKSLEPSFTDGKKLVVPPPNPYALAIADDPSTLQKTYTTPFTSTHYFLKQIKITIANILEYPTLLASISVFSICILLAFALYLITKKKENVIIKEEIILIAALLYPAGYLLIAIEWRYIWVLPILLIIMASILLPFLKSYLSKFLYVALATIIIGSFLILPIQTISKLNNQPKVYSTASALKANGINGSFIANIVGSDKASNTYYYAYLNNNKVYGLFSPDYTYDEVMTEVKKYNIKYFYYYFDTPQEKDAALFSAFAKNAVKIFDTISDDMLVFQLQ